tara:strand:- start:59 stop:1207 length:1149 start_codon:yes stop_codon:yes gene_type:complete
MDLTKIEVVKNIGTGMSGTTYLIILDGKKYAMKIQHILENDRKQDYNVEFWREIDLYNYIGKMKSKNRCFFTQLYAYEIYNDCKHVQKREWQVDPNSKFGRKIAKLDKSPWCIKYITDYKGETVLREYMEKHKLSRKQKYSILLQVCKIIMLLYQGGYMHRDLHSNNIMVTSTNKKYFSLMGKHIPYYGIQLSAIDYGDVIHEKFGMPHKKLNRYFVENKRLFLFHELFFGSTFRLLILNYEKLITDCQKKKKKLPWEVDDYYYHKGIKKMFTKYPNFIDKYMNIYLQSFPKAIKIAENIKTEIINSDKYVWNLMIGNENDIYFWFIVNRLEFHFALEHPDEYKKIFQWCSNPEFILHRKEVLEILKLNTATKYIKYLLSKI